MRLLVIRGKCGNGLDTVIPFGFFYDALSFGDRDFIDNQSPVDQVGKELLFEIVPGKREIGVFELAGSD